MNLSKISFTINFKNKKYFFSIRKDNNKHNSTNRSTKKLIKNRCDQYNKRIFIILISHINTNYSRNKISFINY